ncbi:uncharacterized protein [Triticum aestivum]|uniref:uncharacterized protein isoform X2 n=1 Tax=Triticum aestivum TaxID=4565 RepID=UPI001D02358E|nr:uncharacterized protein LOC123188904 isoform X2 [Triticum aestivum]
MDDRRRGEREVNRWHTGPEEARERDSGSSSPAAILLFALIGATVTTAAVGQLRRTFGWFYTQLSRSEPYVYWEDIPRGPNRCGDAWRYYRRTRETNEDQRKRVERIMHMQDMFKKERSKCRDYRTRNGHNPTYNQHSRREDWYEDAETFYANQRTNFRSRPREAMQYSMSHHYSVLGLNRSRPEPFSDAEIKDCRRAVQPEEIQEKPLRDDSTNDAEQVGKPVVEEALAV